MKSLQIAFLILGTCVFIAHSANATPFSPNVTNDVYGVAQGGVVNGIPTARDDNDGVPDINDAINLLQGTAFGRNKDVDHLFVEPDYVWQQLNGDVALIGLTAGNNNTLGVYTDLGVGNVKTQILGPYSGFGFSGDGTSTNPFPAAQIGLGTGTLFGWYLNSSGGGSVTDYFSESGLNPNQFDHMMTFDLPQANGITIYIDKGAGAEAYTLNDPFLIGWEDLPWNGTTLGDDDYDDMMFICDKTNPIPEPTTFVLMGFGLLGVLGGVIRQRRKGR
jgi:hypothetical protein